MATAQKESALERNKEIGAWIKNHKLASRLTEKEFATKLGISVNLLNNLESGKLSRWFEREGNASEFNIFLRNVKNLTVREIKKKRWQHEKNNL